MKLIRPMVIEQGGRFTLRDGAQTAGTGVVTNILPNLTEFEKLHLLDSKRKREKRAEKEKAEAASAQS